MWPPGPRVVNTERAFAMPIEFACRQCGQRFARPLGDAGKQGKCTCGAVLTIPEAPVQLAPMAKSFVDPPPAPVAVSAEAIAAADENAARSWLLPAAVGVGGLLVVAVVVALLKQGLHNPEAEAVVARQTEATPAEANDAPEPQVDPVPKRPGLGYSITDHLAFLSSPNVRGKWKTILDEVNEEIGFLQYQVQNKENEELNWLVGGTAGDLNSIIVSEVIDRDSDEHQVSMALLAAGGLAGKHGPLPLPEFGHWWTTTGFGGTGGSVQYEGVEYSLLKLGNEEGVVVMTVLTAGKDPAEDTWDSWIAEHPMKPTVEATDRWLAVDGANYSYRSMTYRHSGRFCSVTGEIRNDTGKDHQLAHFDLRLLNGQGRFLGGSAAMVTNFKSGQTRTLSATVECDAEPNAVEIAFAYAM